MQIRQLAVGDAHVLDLVPHGDARGRFTEWYRADVLADAVGHGLPLAQANHSVSARGVLRGVHFALLPPGQAKYVYCPAGRVLDVVIDVRVGSPTFGVHDSVVLDSDLAKAVADCWDCNADPAFSHAVRPLPPRPRRGQSVHRPDTNRQPRCALRSDTLMSINIKYTMRHTRTM